MRRWLWSLVVAIVGFFVGLWWMRERTVTTPALTQDKPTKPTPQDPVTKRPNVTPQNGNGAHHLAEDEDTTSSETVSPSAKEPVSSDALTEINGIGPTFERALNEIGIYTYAQLAEQDPQDLATRLDARGVTAERIERDEWIEQAKAKGTSS
ncbi:MAG: helix-hairpin-helix domain-containing protein [Chloroflexota bacterium]